MRKEKIAFVKMNEEEDVQNDLNKAFVAELKSGPPYVCVSLRLANGKEKASSSSNKMYTFDITKAKQIFDVLWKDKQIVLPKGKKIPSKEEIKRQKFCKFHLILGH